MRAVLDDYQKAAIDEQFRAMLRFAEKLTLTPDELDAEDVAALRAAGIDDAAIENAIYVTFCFNVIDRLADAFDFELGDERSKKWAARLLLGPGYTAGTVPG